jgi:hypothetical protein
LSLLLTSDELWVPSEEKRFDFTILSYGGFCTFYLQVLVRAFNCKDFSLFLELMQRNTWFGDDQREQEDEMDGC